MDDEKLDKLLEYIKPINSFENTEHPITPDYSNLDNWAAYPEKDGQQFYLPDATLALNKNNNQECTSQCRASKTHILKPRTDLSRS